MTTGNIVPFEPRPRTCQTHWHQDELQQLVALYSAHAAHGEASAWDVGATEAGDPQFYVIGPAPEHDCLVSVSRLGRLYVVEDGCGTLVAEDDKLRPVAAAASRMLARPKHASLVVRAFLALCALRIVVEQKLEPIMDEATDTLVRIAPQLSMLV